MRNPTVYRLARRGGIWVLMWAVFAGMSLEWLHHQIDELVRPALKKLRLDRIAPWLAERSLWYLVPIALALVPATFAAKWLEFSLLFSGLWYLGVLLGLVLKVAAVGIGNILVNAYAERLLSISRVKHTYEAYKRIRDELRILIRRQPWYLRAVEIKRTLSEARRATIFAYAHRCAQMHRCCLMAA